MISGGGNRTTWNLNEITPAAPATSTVVVVPPATQLSFLGYGVTTPFQRGRANDFAAAGGADLVKSRVSQILGTSCQSRTAAGELPWRTEFGTRLNHLRHRTKTLYLEKLALHWVLDALAQWEPCVRVGTAKVVRNSSQPRALTLRVLYDIVTTNPVGNRVIFPGETLDVPLNPSGG